MGEETELSQGANYTNTLSVGFILVPNFTLLAFTGFVEVLRHAADKGDLSRQILCRWSLMSTDKEPVLSSCGVEVKVWDTLKRDPTDFDYIVIVGGLLEKDTPKDYLNKKQYREVIAYLRKAAGLKIPIVALCTGSFIVAEAGLLANKRCSVHWYHYQEFAERFPSVRPVSNELYVEDEGIFSSPGGTSTISLAIYIVNKHLRQKRGLKALRHLLLDWGRPGQEVPGKLTIDYPNALDPRVKKAVFLMEKDLAKPLMVEEIAQKVNTSVRQLERLFNSSLNASPTDYYRQIRLKQVEWLLWQTSLSITNIALDCGFNDSSHLAKRFKEAYGCTPGEYRRKNKN